MIKHPNASDIHRLAKAPPTLPILQETGDLTAIVAVYVMTVLISEHLKDLRHCSWC